MDRWNLWAFLASNIVKTITHSLVTSAPYFLVRPVYRCQHCTNDFFYHRGTSLIVSLCSRIDGSSASSLPTNPLLPLLSTLASKQATPWHGSPILVLVSHTTLPIKTVYCLTLFPGTSVFLNLKDSNGVVGQSGTFTILTGCKSNPTKCDCVDWSLNFPKLTPAALENPALLPQREHS